MLKTPSQVLKWPFQLIIGLLFCGALGFHFWGATLAWESNNLPGGEFRQAQTAISSYYIKRDNNYALAYPTPVLGKPWSIPMEFPLYQWSVAWISIHTGMDLTQTGRAVSLACFYLTLPAVFLLLGQLGVARILRLVPLSLILTCPLYIFYSRAFLIETMALMFSLWFLFAFIQAVRTSRLQWLALANLMGIGAGLVKVTTFMLYLMPAGVWALWLLYQSRSTAAAPGWKKTLMLLAWIAGATAVPFAVTLWWIHFADAIKALNPSAGFLLSASLNGFNFGFAGARFDHAIWQALWKVVQSNLAWPPVLGFCLVALVGWGRNWRARSAICLVLWIGVQVLFPQLYAWHDYYSVASAVVLMCALGFGLLALFESSWPRWLSCLALAAALGGQVRLYYGNLFEHQRHLSPGGSGLTEVIGYMTKPDDVIVMAGDDWSSIIPYYAQRRALMIRSGMEMDRDYVSHAWSGLQGEEIGALLLPQERAGFEGILDMAEQMLGIDPRPVLHWRNVYLYLPAKKRAHILANMRRTHFYQVDWMPGSEPTPPPTNNKWFMFSALRADQRVHFEGMTPRPTSFFSEFGPGRGERLARTWYNAHPDTKLRFALAPGRHHLHTEFMLDPLAYDETTLKLPDMSDGVTLTVSAIAADGQAQVLYTRTIDPARVPGDRGPAPVQLDFNLAADSQVEIAVGAGPSGSKSRDWAMLGDIKID